MSVAGIKHVPATDGRFEAGIVIQKLKYAVGEP